MYELQRDEYLYYQQGLHVDLGYLENPPLIGYLGMISSWFGGSVAWIKLWPCLFGAATVVLACLIAAEFGGKLFAQFIAGLSIIGSSFMRVHYLFQPNFLDIFFWTLAIYFLIRFINSKDQQFIYWLAISLAIGWWGKYSILFMVIAIVTGLALSPYRSVFTKKKTWLAVGLALLIISPNILWQYWFNWPLAHHMQELQETQLKYVNKFDFLKEQLMMLLPVAAVWIAGLIWVLGKREWRIIGIIYLSVIALLFFGSGKAYYALGAYPMLLAAGAVIWERLSERKHWIRYTLAIFIIGLNCLIIPALLPSRNPGRLAEFYKKIGMKQKWEDQQEHPLPQDYADMLGWKELAAKTEKFFNSLPDSSKANSFIYASNYGMAGSVKFYCKDSYLTSKVISTSGSFLLWIPQRLLFKNLVFISEEVPDKDDDLLKHFEKATVVDSVTDKFSRQYGNKIIYYENIDTAGMHVALHWINGKLEKFGQ